MVKYAESSSARLVCLECVIPMVKKREFAASSQEP